MTICRRTTVIVIVLIGLTLSGRSATLASALADRPQLAAMVWGFHFLVGVALALALRVGVTRLGSGEGLPLHDGLLGRISTVMVDVLTELTR